jgi:alcohol dehydrogenase (cytochrome c)
MPGELTKRMCPSASGGNNYWPSAYSPKTKLMYIPALTACADFTRDSSISNKAAGWRGGVQKPTDRYETDVLAADPLTGEIKAKTHIPYPNYAGALVTAGGVVFTAFTDGTVMALDDTTMAPLWKINVGVGFNAPPMTFEAGGKQYVAIMSGLSRVALGKHVFTPELKDQRNQTMLFVFGL